MNITSVLLRNEVAAMKQRQTQQLGELNVTNGALQVLEQLLALAEKPIEPAPLAVIEEEAHERQPV